MAEYKPLFVYLEPASIPQVVAHIQKYLEDNPIISDEETIAELIREYIAAHPELLAVSSVNGETGNVVLTGSNININTSSAVSIETQLLNLASMISTAGADIAQINAQLETIYTNIGTIGTNVSNNTSAISALQTSVEEQGTRLSTAENDIEALESAQYAQNTRLNAAEGNISSLQTRMKQAETDIDNAENSIATMDSKVLHIVNCSIIFPSSFSINPHSSMRFDVDLSNLPLNAIVVARLWGYAGNTNCIITHAYSSYAYIYNLSDTAVTSLQATSIYMFCKLR